MKHFESYEFRNKLTSPVEPHPLDSVITPRRAERFRQVLARRTVGTIVVLDECYDPHNATAVVRSCEAFGIQHIRVIAGRNAFRVNKRISQGAHRYVNIKIHATIGEAYDLLRRDGFRILAANLSAEDIVDPNNLAEISNSSPLALVFGNEESGVSREGIDNADGSFFIPMCGFTQSLNLSVSVAIVLFSIRSRAIVADSSGNMAADEQRDLYDRWIHRQTKIPSSSGDHQERP